VRLVTWNVAGRVRRQPEQAEVLARSGADVVALQEVTARTLRPWRASCEAMGLMVCECSLDAAPAVKDLLAHGNMQRLLGAD